jgi:hypothetical protein
MARAGGTLSLLLLATSSHGQAVAAADPVAAGRPQVPAPIVADAQSCTALKDALRSAGTLTVVPEQRSWGETFYGPDVPQCQVWQRPMYKYVSASDGACGLGYICVERTTGGR